MIALSYFTIKAPSEGIFKEKGSKFMSFAYPVSTEAEIADKLSSLKKRYYDARHHCFGYVLGHPEKKSLSFDAGEPRHSAGDPILGRIRSKNLENVLVVVVRYFGGVKLGVGGLVQAYRLAAEEALNNAITMELEITEMYSVNYDYSASAGVMKLVNDYDLKVLQQGFKERGEMLLELKLRNKEKFLEKVELLRALKVDLILKRIEHSIANGEK